MTLTKSFKETIAHRAAIDPEFRREMLIEAINEFLAGNVELAKNMLRDYINATITFEPLAEQLHKNSKSIQRMLGPNGNPTTSSLFAMLHYLQQYEGVQLRVHIN